VNSGLAFFRQGNDAEAEQDFERGLALNPASKPEPEKRIELVKK